MTSRIFRKLPARSVVIVQPLVLSMIMSFLVSGIATLRAIGLTPDFISSWIGSWWLSWLVAFPTLLAILPIVRRLVALIVDLPDGHK